MAQPPQNITQDTFIAAVDHVIRERKTAKVLGDPDNCTELSPQIAESFISLVRTAVEVAGCAPFHKLAADEHRRGQLDSPVPWRFYVLDKPACCAVLSHLRSRADTDQDPKWARAMAKKIPKLLAGTGALVLVTWLPDPSPTGEPALNENNIEHIAAASAATQNILLAAEARNMHTYWSSGGILAEAEVFELLGIPRQQRLLAAIFLAPADEVTVDPELGANRKLRGQNWMKWVHVDDIGQQTFNP